MKVTQNLVLDCIDKKVNLLFGGSLMEMDIVLSNIAIAFICQYIVQSYHTTCCLMLNCALHVMLFHVCVPTIHHATELIIWICTKTMLKCGWA